MTRPGFRLLTSDRLEILAGDLAERMQSDPLPPLESEVVVVGSRGMGRWLSLFLARRLGIAASMRTPFPFAWARETVDRVLGVVDREGVDPFGADALTWRVHALLGSLERLEVDADTLAPLRRYLADDVDGRKRGQLAMRLARLFGAYQTLRPDGLERWGRGDSFGDEAEDDAGERWQAVLWRRLVDDARPARPLSSGLHAATRRLHEGPLDAALPVRVHMFGLTSLPPALLDLLQALAGHVEVTVATLAPTREYVGDLRPRRRGGQADLFEAPAVHPLLQEWGMGYAELQDELTSRQDQGAQELERFDERPRPDTVLGRLQEDLLEARAPDAPGSRHVLAPDDRSLRVHLCHSERREIEVLRDEILRAFEDGVVSEPSDVLVLVPDIDRYAPFVRAVFESERPTTAHDAVRLPVRVADGRQADDSPYVRLALALLGSAGGRATATEIVELVETPPVARRFNLDSAGTGEVRDLVRRAAIRFGREPQAWSEDFDLPPLDGGTWREGIDRLLLGFALGTSEFEIEGQVPVADATTSRSAAVGRLDVATSALFEWLDALTSPRSLDAWCRDLRRALFALTAPADADDAFARADLAARLDTMADAAVADDPEVGRHTFLAALERRLADDAAGVGFVSGSVTVAELRPMRSLPYAMIAVAGLDGDSFPRRDPRDPLDLIARTRRRGDPSPRREDRQVMLEVLGAARERLVLTAIGHSQRDGREQARSVCLDELTGVIDRAFEPVGDVAPSRALTVHHHLQPFHAKYGSGESAEHFTYDRATIEAAIALASPSRPPSRFVDVELDDGLPRDGDGRVVVTLDELTAFWANPSRWFVRRVLGLDLHFDDEELGQESFRLDPLGSYRLREWMVGRRTDLPSPLEIARRAERELGLVSGVSGRLSARSTVEATLHRWNTDAFESESVETLDVDLSGPTWRLTGVLEVHRGTGIVVLEARRQKIKALLPSFVRHVVYGALELDRTVWPWSTKIHFPEEGSREFGGDAGSMDVATLVEGFVTGHRRPLRYFPETAQALWKAADPKSLLDDVLSARTLWSEAAKAWSGNEEGRGEGDDESVRLCTRGLDGPDVIDDELSTWTRRFGAALDAALASAKARAGSKSKSGSSSVRRKSS